MEGIRTAEDQPKLEGMLLRRIENQHGSKDRCEVHHFILFFYSVLLRK